MLRSRTVKSRDKVIGVFTKKWYAIVVPKSVLNSCVTHIHIFLEQVSGTEQNRTTVTRTSVNCLAVLIYVLHVTGFISSTTQTAERQTGCESSQRVRMWMMAWTMLSQSLWMKLSGPLSLEMVKVNWLSSTRHTYFIHNQHRTVSPFFTLMV